MSHTGFHSVLTSLGFYQEAIHPDSSKPPNTNIQWFLSSTVCKWKLSFLTQKIQHKTLKNNFTKNTVMLHDSEPW